jgi:hypothetical protein
MFGSIHSEDRVDNDFQARIDQLSLTGRPIDRQTMVDLAEQVRIRLGLRAGKPEELIGMVQQLIDLSQQQQRVRPDATRISHDPDGETTTANDNPPPSFPSESDADAQLPAPNGGALEHAMLNMEQYAEMNEQLAAETRDIESRLFSTASSSHRDFPATVPDMFPPPQQQQRQPFASRTNAPTSNRAPHYGEDGDAKSLTEQLATPMFREMTSPPRPNPASVREPPTTSPSSSRSSMVSSNHSVDDSSIPSPASHRCGLRDGDDQPHLERSERQPHRSEQVDRFLFDTTLLRRVTTLADVVEGRRVTSWEMTLAFSISLESAIEAELVNFPGHFPSEFRWEALQACLQAIDVLWLSPTVFVSRRDLADEDRHDFLRDFIIVFRSWDHEKILQ